MKLTDNTTYYGQAVPYHYVNFGASAMVCALGARVEYLNKEELNQWYDLIKHILNNGKSVQVYAQPREVDDLIKNVGTRGMLVTCPSVTNDEAEALLERYGKW